MYFADAKRRPTYADLSFALLFSDHDHFTHAMDLCGRGMLHGADPLIGKERALIFWNLPRVLVVAEKWSVHLHLVNSHFQFFDRHNGHSKFSCDLSGGHFCHKPEMN